MKALKTIIFILITVGMIWLVAVLIGNALSPKTAKTTTTQKTALVSYADTDTVVSMYIDGPVESDLSHEALRISVTKNQVKVELINGYEGKIARQDVFENNPVSYAAFLDSLDKAKFDRTVSSSISADERGYCPLRNRFIYRLDNGSTELVRAWTSSCGMGNYTGDSSLTRRLFIDQVPDDTFRDIVNQSDMSTF